MILPTKPTKAKVIDTGGVYAGGGVALNAMIALNAMVALGGSPYRKVSLESPLDATIYRIAPIGGIKTIQKPQSALFFNINPTNARVLKGYESNAHVVPSTLSGQPMGLLLSITYP